MIKAQSGVLWSGKPWIGGRIAGSTVFAMARARHPPSRVEFDVLDFRSALPDVVLLNLEVTDHQSIKFLHPEGHKSIGRDGNPQQAHGRRLLGRVR